MNAALRGNIWVLYLAARDATDDGDSPDKADGLFPNDVFEPDANDEDRCQQSDAPGRREGRTGRGARIRTRDKVVSRGSIC